MELIFVDKQVYVADIGFLKDKKKLTQKPRTNQPTDMARLPRK